MLIQKSGCIDKNKHICTDPWINLDARIVVSWIDLGNLWTYASTELSDNTFICKNLRRFMQF